MDERQGAIELDFPPGRARTLALAGALLGFPGVGLWVAALLALWVLGRSQGPAGQGLSVLLALLALVLCAVVPPLLLRARQPAPAQLRWDRDTIVERDGERVRTALRWVEVRATVSATPRGRIVQLRDDRGRTITVAEGRAAPRWLSRRRASAPSLALLVDRVVDLPPGPPVEPDARDGRRPLPHRGSLALIGATGLFGALVLVVSGLGVVVPPFGALVMALLWSVPARRPIHELAALAGQARRFERAEPAEIEDVVDGRAVLRRADRTLVQTDLDALAHPDAGLAIPGRSVRITLPIAGWVPAAHRRELKGTVPLEAVETEDDRLARAELARAVAAELCARALPVLFWAVLAFGPVLGD